MNYCNAILLTTSISFAGASCTHTSLSPEKNESRDIQVQAKTGELPNLSKESQPIPPWLLVPSDLLSLKKIMRPATPLREGPGTRFPIQEDLLPWGTMVAETDQHQIWRKVITLNGLKTGWVHYQTLGKEVTYHEPVRLPSHMLPIRHTRQKILEVKDYPGNKPVQTVIPEDRGFLQFRAEPGRTLLWITETNSVAWFPKHTLY